MPKGEKKIWHRAPGEGFKAYELFMTYLSLGGERSPSKVAEVTARTKELCYQMSTKFKWATRARAYDDWMVQVQEQAIETTLQKDAITFAQRRSEYRHLEYSLALDLIRQGREMANAPLYDQVVTEYKMVKTLEHPEGEQIPVQFLLTPAKWSKRDGVAYLKVASEIMRLSLELDTQRIGVTVNNMDDPKVRLAMARASYDKLKGDINSLVDEQMEATPDADRMLITIKILENLPKWVASNWKLDESQIPLLTAGDEVLPLSADDLNSGPTEDHNQGPVM